MKIDYRGKVVMITGAARGIGLSLAQGFAESGAAVMLTDLKADRARAAAKQVKARGHPVTFCRHDVSLESHWQEAIAHCVAKLGRLDVLVNNAGVEESGVMAEFDPEAFRRMLDVNVTGTFLGLKYGLQAMRPGGMAGNGGAILNVSSMVTLSAHACLGPYGASKAAVEHLTRVAAVEAGKLGWNVRVNCLYPGFINSDVGTRLASDLVRLGFVESPEAAARYFTQRTPLGRVGEPEDLIGAALFLCSDAAAYITGAGLSIDGGASLG